MDFPLEALRDTVAELGGILGAALDGTTPRSLSDTDLIDSLRLAEDLGRWTDAARVALAGEVGRRSEADLGDNSITTRYGTRDAADLVERVTHVSAATARERIRTARAITPRKTLTGADRPAPLDRAREEFTAGRLSLDALTTIVNALRPLQGRCGADELAAAELELVHAATGDPARDGGSDDEGAPPCSIHELRIMAQTWALFLDPDGTLPGETIERLRAFRLGRERNGLFPLRGNVTADVAAQLQRLLDAHTNPRSDDRGPRFTDPAASGPADSEASDVDIRDGRTADQKRHDAFAAILGAAASAVDAPRLGGAAPTLVVTVAEDQLHRPDGVAFVDGPDGATPVPAAFARHIGCDGAIHRVVFDERGAIVQLTVHDRVFNRRQRRAITARDGGCIIPGCRVRAAWCEVHHVVEASRGGPTSVDNGVLLCWHHHRTIETNGWLIRMTEGMPQVRPPTWVDPRRRWRPANRAMHVELERARAASA